MIGMPLAVVVSGAQSSRGASICAIWMILIVK